MNLAPAFLAAACIWREAALVAGVAGVAGIAVSFARLLLPLPPPLLVAAVLASGCCGSSTRQSASLGPRASANSRTYATHA